MTEPETLDIAPVCCRPDDTCFRRTGPAWNVGCLAGVWNTGSFVSLSWYDAMEACEAEGASLCTTRPFHIGSEPNLPPNCKGSGCSQC